VSAGSETLAELVGSRADDNSVGLWFEDQSWTWREVVAECEARASALRALRVPGPFHVGVLLENTPEFLFVIGGAALAGAAIVGINPTRRGEELARDIRHTDCQLVVTDETLAHLLDGLDLGVPSSRIVTESVWSIVPPPGATIDQTDSRSYDSD
jgi:fatty-acyl-CoA synthase